MADEPLEKALGKSMLFAGIADQERSALLEIARKKRYPKNSALFSEGDTAHGFFLIVLGKVKVIKIAPDGKEHILHIFGPGEPLGEVAVFSGKHFPASAYTLKESLLLYFPRNAFLDLSTQRPQILLNMLATLSIRLRQFAQKIERLTLKEVASRLAEVLLETARESAPEKSGVVELKITKGQLASQIGTTPETLSRTFQKLTNLGMITVDRKRVTLLDLEGLEDLAQGEHRSDR